MLVLSPCKRFHQSVIPVSRSGCGAANRSAIKSSHGIPVCGYERAGVEAPNPSADVERGAMR